jgi:adenylosuccinate lyase
MTILQEFGAFDERIEAELNEYLPLLATTKILMECVKAGMGREEGHKLIKKHSTTSSDFFEALAKEKEFPLSLDQLNGLVKDPADFAGMAVEQSESVAKKIELVTSNKISKVELSQLR